MFRLFITTLLSLAAAAPTSTSAFTVSKSIYDTASIRFQNRGSYLQMTLNYAPVHELYEQVQAMDSGDLANRGEAHITVLKPDEYRTLASTLGKGRIEDVAKQLKLQESKFSVTCVGKGSSGSDYVYYLVVTSPALVNIRKALAKAHVDKGGDESAFDPVDYRPHVTLGFTSHDLFEQDGVYKTADTCVQDVKVV
jgi:2'-5' RNA ligase